MSEDLDSRRGELFDINTNAWNGNYLFSIAPKLDASLKKNTTFIKKIKTSMTIDQTKSILKDIETLSLEKYMSELITAVSEGVFKINKSDDIASGIEIVSALHQRFTYKFTPYLLSNIIIGLSNPLKNSISDPDKEKEDHTRISRQKNLLRVLMEFYLVGIVRTFDDCAKDVLPEMVNRKFGNYSDEPIIILVLKDILNYDIKSGNSLQIAQIFLKRFYHIIYDEKNESLSLSTKKTIISIFERYTAVIFENLTKLYKKLEQVSDKYKRSTIRTGKILDEHVIDVRYISSQYEKFKVNSEFLSVTLKIEMPTLFDSKEIAEESVVEIVKNKSANEDNLEIWDSISERDFYTKITPLEELVGNNLPTQNDNVSGGERISDFISKLDNMSNEVDVNNLVLEFNSLKLNNKATRNRILKFLIETTNKNNLKYYARFLKINEVNLKDLIEDLIDYLDKGFRSQIYYNKLNLKNIFFFVELVKFKMIPTHIIFHKIRSLTININATNNIDILSVFYESVGRFLLHEPEYKVLMKEMIELLKLKQKNESLSINDKLAVNNLLIIINPPTTAVRNIESLKPKLSSTQKFLIRLLRVELNLKTSSTILQVLKKINFSEDLEARSTLLDIFSKPELLNYENITDLAVILNAISRRYKEFLAITVDTIIEKIIRGLEVNDYRLNRARISHVKLITELYNLGLLNFKFINDILYKIICYGHPDNQPLPNNYSVQVDMPNNYFRIHLCFTILSSINSVFIVGNSKKLSSNSNSIRKKIEANEELLRVFLIFFQFYIYCKELPMPMDIEFKLDDLFVKFIEIGDIRRSSGLDDSIQQLKEVIASKGLIKSNKISVDCEYEDDEDDDDEEEEEEDDDDNDDEEEDDDDDDYYYDEDEDEIEEEEEEEDAGYEDDYEDDYENVNELDRDSDSDSDTGSESDVDLMVVSDGEEVDTDLSSRFAKTTILSEEDKKFSEELEKEYQRIVFDSYELNKNNPSTSRSKVNIPLPPKAMLSPNPKNTGGKSFSLLTKNGKKLNFAPVSLPTDNKFAESLMKEKADQQEQKEKIMNLILNMKD